MQSWAIGLGFYAFISMHLHLGCLYYKLCQHRGLELEERQEGCWGQSWIFWEPNVLIHPLGSSEPKPAIQNCNSIIYRELEDSRCCWYLTHRQGKHHSYVFTFEHQVEETSWKMYGWQLQVTFNDKLWFKQLNGRFECKGERTWVEIPGTWRIRFAIHHPWTCTVG